MNKNNAFAINFNNEDFVSVKSDDVLATAQELRSDYPSVKRFISIDSNVQDAISAAYKTASGLAVNGQVITDSIYKLSKLEIAMLIASNDDSPSGAHKAAYELARDVFMTGDLVGKSEVMALVSGKSVAECQYMIERKLERMSAELHRRTQRMSSIYEDAYTIAPAGPDEIFEDIKRGGKFLLNLPTGYGKTSKVIDPVVRDAIFFGQRVLVISHRRSINSNICTEIDGMVSYDECTSPDIIKNARALKVVVNSLASAKFAEFIKEVDVVVIDEASQVINHVLGGEVKDREKVWDALNFVVKNAETVVLSDADINARCVEMIGWDHKLYSLKRDHSDITVKTADIEHVRGMAIEAAASGETVLIAIDGAKSAKALAASIKKRTGKEPLLITSENAKWENQAEFIANPNSTEHDIVIYSPVITSALSITSGHFKKHFGLFSGQIVPSDAIQMLRRDRTSKEFIVGMKAPEYSKQEQVQAIHVKDDAPTLRKALDEANIDENLKATLIEALDFDIKPSAFESMRYEHLLDEAWMRDNIQNTLPATMLSQGFRVEVLEHSDEMARIGFVADSQGRKSVNAEAAEAVMASMAAKADKVAQVKDGGSIDAVEHFQVVRARAEQVIGRSGLTEADSKVWKEGEGEGAINRFRKLMSENLTCPNMLAIKEAVKAMAGGAAWTSDSSAGLFDILNSDRLGVIRSGFSIGKANTVKAKQAAVTKIMAQLGLKTKKRDGGKSGDYYIITKESFDQMSSYLK